MNSPGQFIKTTERPFAEAVSHLSGSNPFLPERIDYERQALGADFLEAGADWNIDAVAFKSRANVDRITERATQLAKQLRNRLISGANVTDRDWVIYQDLVLLPTYYRHAPELDEVIESQMKKTGARQRVSSLYKTIAREVDWFLKPEEIKVPPAFDSAHVFACFLQIRRAFGHIFNHIIGVSKPVAKLRAAAWESIFTYDVHRFWRSLYDRMGDVTCLITGPSGTGKELVARAIGLSRYVPFDRTHEAVSGEGGVPFYVLNLSAMSPTLVESELFGHRHGAFTGALEDRAGWLEVCSDLGTVFLDEIAEVDVGIQVKLLRVLQTRAFQRIGETEPRRFEGKLVAATNRDLVREMRDGHFREDLYYRLCSDLIETPSLGERLADSPEELSYLVKFIARRLAGEEEAEHVAREVEEWVEQRLGRDYPWPGNVRELEQCVRNVMIRKVYHPPRIRQDEQRCATEQFVDAVRKGQMTADDLLRHYCTLVYTQTGSYQETARRLQIDRRTVKAKVDPELFAND